LLAGHAAFEGLLPGGRETAGMEIERQTVYEVVLSGGAAAAFLAVLFVVSSTFTVDGAVTSQGGLALVGALAFFVLLMAGVGLIIYRFGE
jgi:formate/nitrite transporter FocA (FNT family)